MAWVPLKDTPLVKMMQRLAKLQAAVTELVAKEKLNDARARILSTRRLHHIRTVRKEQKATLLKEKERNGKI